MQCQGIKSNHRSRQSVGPLPVFGEYSLCSLTVGECNSFQFRFPAVRRRKDRGQRLIDGIILPKGEHKIGYRKDVSLEGKDIIVVQTKRGRCENSEAIRWRKVDGFRVLEVWRRMGGTGLEPATSSV
jgi:hypothetical protein